MDIYVSKNTVQAGKYEKGMEDLWVVMPEMLVPSHLVQKPYPEDESLVLVAAISSQHCTLNEQLIGEDDMIVIEDGLKYTMSTEDFHNKFMKI